MALVFEVFIFGKVIFGVFARSFYNFIFRRRSVVSLFFFLWLIS